MFSLIITIVSIALVVALVAATMYHGGDTLTQGRNTADAAAFVAGAQQVAGAQVMHISLEGERAADVAALITKNYLASPPSVKGTVLTLAAAPAKTVNSTVNSVEVCSAINKSAGVRASATAAANDTDGALIVVASELLNLAYGCVTADKNFSFKY